MLEARFFDDITAIPAADWNRLADDDNPFVKHAFLAALEQFGCIPPEWGWQAHHLGLYRDGTLVAAAPLYLKGNSRGEFVFDFGWADAFERAGGRYYPKLLNAAPWSPVNGPRLLVGRAADADRLRRELVQAMQAECTRLGLSSIHANFLRPQDAAAFGSEWLARSDLQFHWHNRGYADFDDFLSGLRHKKRKNIRRERAQAARSGLDCRMLDGARLDEPEWQAIHTLYQATFADKGNLGVLNVAFFQHLAARPDINVPLALARRGQQIVAMALFFESRDTLYGRYWGSREQIPGLHFELCYYLGIQHCIHRGLQRFEPGAQGPHKMARGFLPTRTHSRHFIAHPGLRAAVAEALQREHHAIDGWRRELEAHTPYADTSHHPAISPP